MRRSEAALLGGGIGRGAPNERDCAFQSASVAEVFRCAKTAPPLPRGSVSTRLQRMAVDCPGLAAAATTVTVPVTAISIKSIWRHSSLIHVQTLSMHQPDNSAAAIGRASRPGRGPSSSSANVSMSQMHKEDICSVSVGAGIRIVGRIQQRPPRIDIRLADTRRSTQPAVVTIRVGVRVRRAVSCGRRAELRASPASRQLPPSGKCLIRAAPRPETSSTVCQRPTGARIAIGSSSCQSGIADRRLDQPAFIDNLDSG